MLAAWREGAAVVKVFPAATGGPSHLAALHAVYPEIPLCPTGGVSATNLLDYFKAGAAVVGIGNNVIDQKALAEGDRAQVIAVTHRTFSNWRNETAPDDGAHRRRIAGRTVLRIQPDSAGEWPVSAGFRRRHHELRDCGRAAGREAGYITRLGDDEFGRQFLQLWRDEGLDISGVGIDPQAHTAVYFITHGPAGHVFSYLRKGSAASRMRPADLPLELIRKAKFFHTSGISQAISDSACDAVFAALEAARVAGVRIAYDSNLRLRLWPLARARAVIRATIVLADYFLLSMEDAEALCGEKDADAILDWCHEAGAKVVALKLGAAGRGRKRFDAAREDFRSRGQLRRCHGGG